MDLCFHVIRCPMCFASRQRFRRRGWFMRHMEITHGLNTMAALNYWLEGCGQLTLSEDFT